MRARTAIAGLPDPDPEISHLPVSGFVDHFASNQSTLRLKLDGNICRGILRTQPDFGVDGFGIFIKWRIRRHVAVGHLVGHDLISSRLRNVDYEFSLGV